MTPLEMLLSGGRRQGRSELRRPPDAVALGPQALNIVSQSSPTGTQCLQAVGCAEGGLLYEKVTAHRGPRRVPFKRRGRLRLDRRRHDERRRVLGVAEHRLPRQAAGRLPGRGQRLRDLGAGRSADAGRRHLEARVVVPGPLRPEHRRHRLPRELRAMRRGGRHARARKGPALVHAR